MWLYPARVAPTRRPWRRCYRVLQWLYRPKRARRPAATLRLAVCVGLCVSDWRPGRCATGVVIEDVSPCELQIIEGGSTGCTSAFAILIPVGGNAVKMMCEIARARSSR